MKNIFAEVLEDTALEQFNDAMKQPFVVKGALMPDAHTGYSLPIGAVVATDNYIIPSWVGYDIGCGMCACKTTFEKEDIVKSAKEIFDYFGFVDRWRKHAIDDKRSMYWEIRDGLVRFAPNKKAITDDVDKLEFYEEPLYITKNTNKNVCRGEEFTMILINIDISSNTVLVIFDNTKEIKE